MFLFTISVRGCHGSCLPRWTKGCLDLGGDVYALIFRYVHWTCIASQAELFCSFLDEAYTPEELCFFLYCRQVLMLEVRASWGMLVVVVNSFKIKHKSTIAMVVLFGNVKMCIHRFMFSLLRGLSFDVSNACAVVPPVRRVPRIYVSNTRRAPPKNSASPWVIP